MRKLRPPMLLLLACAACSSPTGFVVDRDVALTIEDAKAVLSPDGTYVHVVIPITIRNNGDRWVRYIRHCGGAGLKLGGGEWFAISGACALANLDEVEILPGETAVDLVTFSKLRSTWVGTGGFVLGMGLFVEGQLDGEVVTSAPFSIQLQAAP